MAAREVLMCIRKGISQKSGKNILTKTVNNVLSAGDEERKTESDNKTVQNINTETSTENPM